MLLKINLNKQEDFPLKIIEYIGIKADLIADMTFEEQEAIWDDGVTVELIFNKEALSAVNKETLETLCSRVAAILLTYQLNLKQFIKIADSSFSQLNLQQVQLFLDSLEFIPLLHPDEFKRLLVSSNEAAEFALQKEHIRQYLNALNPSETTQTFPSSCAAKSILLMMQNMGQISPNEATSHKEFQIYKEIWDAPGQVAEPGKLLDFLEKNKLPVISVALEDRVNLSLEQAATKDPSLIAAYGIFKNRSKTFHNIPSSQDYSFPNNTIALVMVDSAPLTGGHLVFCRSNSYGEVSITDPTTGKVSQHKNFKEFMATHNELGVHFQLGLDD